MFVTLKDRSVVLREYFGSNGFSNNNAHFLLSWPYVAQKDRLSIDICAYRVFRQIDIHRSCQRIGHYKRGRGKEAGTHLRMDAPFKIAVTTQYRCDNKVVILDGLSNRFC